MTNELTGGIEILRGAIERMQQWPAAVLIVVALVAVGYVIRAIEAIPNRFIPVVLMVLGVVGNYFLGAPNEAQRNPMVVLGVQGLILAFAAWLLHSAVLKRLEKFITLAGNQPDDKPKDKQP